MIGPRAIATYEVRCTGICGAAGQLVLLADSCSLPGSPSPAECVEGWVAMMRNGLANIHERASCHGQAVFTLDGRPWEARPS